ncbi:MAG: FMN-binding protein [Bacteroidales bacterium]|jgi:hypothetical protein|nr:FMN-binding protein [Bacteroidales bacterium]
MKFIILFIFNLNLLILPPSGVQDSELPRSLNRDLRKQMGIENPDFKLISSYDHSANSAFYAVEQNKKLAAYTYIGRVFTCRSGGCNAPSVNNQTADSEYFDYYIMFDTEATVKFVKVYNYAATHGQEISAAWWLRQFEGYQGKERLQSGKNIDAISGATISAVAATNDIQFVTKQLIKLINDLSHQKQTASSLK